MAQTPANKRRKALYQLAREQRLSRRLEAIDGTAVELQPKSKMRNRKVEYRGVEYDSTAEAEYAAHLDRCLLSGEALEVRRQVRVVVSDGPKHADRTYMIIDYWVVWADERGGRFEDVKGRILPEWMLKVKMGWKRRVPHPLWVVQKNKGQWAYKQMADGILPAWLDSYR